MTNVRIIHVDWYNQRPLRSNGGPQLAFQGDHLSNMVVFDNAPEQPNYYLLVEMKTDDAGIVDTLPAIQLEGPYWVIPNYYTQICQQIMFQVCCKTETGDYEHHSAKFKGAILPVLKHNGEPIDQSPMFDPYIDILDKRVEELIIAAGDIQIDSEFKSDSGNPVQNRVVKAAIDGLEDDVDAVNGRLDQYENELGYAPPDTYTGTITEANVNTTIADNLSFARSTQYKYTFSIQSAINTNVYVYLKRGGESDSNLFSKTIAPGETSAVKLYTTSSSYDITEGYIVAAANATGVTVNVAIEPAEGMPTRLDTIETDVTAHGTAIDGLTSRTTVLESEVGAIDVSVNRLNPFTVTTGKYIKMDGTKGNSASLLYTDYIKVNPGERVNLVNDGVCDTNTRFRYLTAYDSEKVVIPASGKETSYRYDVPEGVSYIIMTLYATDYAGGKLAVNINSVLAYSAYGDAFPIVDFAQRLKQYPYGTLPDYVLGGAWYKPLGSLSKGYFCFVTDDGRIGMNEYTIPTLVIGKGVKCTFAIMSASEVMADAEKIAVVKDAVDNYGCSVAQHGGNRWTSFNEYQLNEFFDTEKAFFDGIGIEVRGAVIPEHYNSQLIYAVAGGKYGVVRSGYNGHIYPTVCPYANYSNGPRSNLYGLTSYNIVDMSLANNKAAVDSALANHRLMIVYIHENSLDNAKKAVIEGLMDYVNETGITQITLGDIPNLI